MSISYDDNYYTTSTSKLNIITIPWPNIKLMHLKMVEWSDCQHLLTRPQEFIGLEGSVHQWSRTPGSNPRLCHTKDFKNGTWYLKTPWLTLSNIRYISRIKWSNQGKGVALSHHLSIVGIEKGAFWSRSTTVANFFTYIINHEMYSGSATTLSVGLWIHWLYFW